MESVLWVEKYRPKKLDEMVNQEAVIERLKYFIKNRNIPHMLFAGPAGCGKTTAALCVVRELFGDDWKSWYLELNASDERGINTIRGKVKDFARTKSLSGLYKIIILDEADALTSDAQQALRRMMEKYASTCRFILICNYSSKIIEPIQSRCVVFRFRSLEPEDVSKFLSRISESEGLEVEDGVFEAIYDISGGDLRKAVTILQACASEGRVSVKRVYEISAAAEPGKVRKMLESALSGDFASAREVLHDILYRDGVAGQDIVREIMNQLRKLELPDDKRIELIREIGECEFRISQGSDPRIQLEALLAAFSV
ncbi:MAG: replication factor C small subunit [Candidatus Micrarchaeota archaeon]|nr:replication factor C small subunit [Candidatus Micrarchaeota archaeon]